MSTALHIYFLNSKYIEPRSLFVLACVDKESNKLALDIWKEMDPNIHFVKTPYHQGANICRYCNSTKRIVTEFGCCNYCSKENMNIITKTEVVKKYKLQEDDMRRLTYRTVRSMYGGNMRLFDHREVYNYALMKYKGPWNLPKRREGVSAALTTRKKKLRELLEKLKLDETNYKLCVEEYLKNGKGGIREVKARIERQNAFDALKLQLDVIDFGQDMRCDCIYGNITLKEAHTGIMGSIRRKEELVTALGSVGLLLRTDSKLCSQYIRYGDGDLDTIVKTCRQMNFLYTKTNYPGLMKIKYQEIKEEISWNDGWLPSDEFHDLVREEMQLAQPLIKKEAVLHYMKRTRDTTCLPDYMTELLDVQEEDDSF